MSASQVQTHVPDGAPSAPKSVKFDYTDFILSMMSDAERNAPRDDGTEAESVAEETTETRPRSVSQAQRDDDAARQLLLAQLARDADAQMVMHNRRWTETGVAENLCKSIYEKYELDGEPLLRSFPERGVVPELVDPTREEFERIVYGRGKSTIPFVLRKVGGLMRGVVGQGDAAVYKALRKGVGEDVVVSVQETNDERFKFVGGPNFTFRNMTFGEYIDMVERTGTDTNTQTSRHYWRSTSKNPRTERADVWETHPELLEAVLPGGPSALEALRSYAVPESPHFFSSIIRVCDAKFRLWTHYDTQDNALMQFAGSKRVVLFPPESTPLLYTSEYHSAVLDIDTPDLERYPLFKHTQSIETVLEPGDLLFIPSTWWHNVSTEGPAVGLNVFWRHLDEHIYPEDDLYGNGDFKAAKSALDLIEAGVLELKKSEWRNERSYRKFYALKALHSVLSLFDNDDEELKQQG